MVAPSTGVVVDNSDFDSGGLLVASFARPGKLFTAHSGLLVKAVGVLGAAALGRVIHAVLTILKPGP